MNKGADKASKLGSDDGFDARDIEDLVRRARSGDESAFGELVQAYHERVYAVVYRFVNNVDDANELAQQTWIKVWRKLDTFKGKSGFFTWVYRVASYVSLDFLRKRARRREEQLLDGVEPVRVHGAGLPASSNPRPDREAERAEIQERFDAALERLSPQHRQALVLREVEGLSYEDVARVMGCRKGTVMSRLYYARKQMQGFMEDVR